MRSGSDSLPPNNSVVIRTAPLAMVRRRARAALRLAAGLVVVAAGSGFVRGDVKLPGTQPEEGGITLKAAQQCLMCHSGTASGASSPYESWQGGMMSLAARDPVFRAALTIANQDIAGVGEYCLRCHTPRAWVEGRSTPADGSALTEADLAEGVSCSLCHRLEDPTSKDAASFVKETPPGLGNAMMVVDPTDAMRGPYDAGLLASGRIHGAKQSDWFSSGHLCGTCHNVSNPLQAKDANTQPPWAYGHIERTYSEWLLSDFASEGAKGSCQSCHYPALKGGGAPTRLSNELREYFVEHGPVGGSTWVQDATWEAWQGIGLNRRALDRGKTKARDLLKTAATLELTYPSSKTARLKITNNTGHKLPTGYPEGRRMWVNVRFYDAAGELLDEIGKYGETDDTLKSGAVRVPTLLDPQRTRIYESLPGLSEAQAAKHGLSPGPSFHFILNDVIVKDNRIPPRGFKNDKFAEHLCAPVGAKYADGQYWDEVDWELPPGTARVEARLMYQSVSWEYLKFFVETNKTDDWGVRLHAAWEKTGRCPPEIIAEISSELATKR